MSIDIWPCVCGAQLPINHSVSTSGVCQQRRVICECGEITELPGLTHQQEEQLWREYMHQYAGSIQCGS